MMISSLIDQDQDKYFDDNVVYSENSITNHKIIELKGKFIPKGLVPLEILFSQDDTLLKPTMQSSEENVLSCNIGTMDQAKMVKVSEALLVGERNRYVKLLQEFVDIFAWYYEDLKTYDTSIIQYKVPLKPTTNPFR